jgi:hypothetical protein
MQPTTPGGRFPLFNMVQSYENYLNYPNISAIILLKINDLSVK